jgi:hypothetical protein
MNVLYSIRIIACWWHIICTMYDECVFYYILNEHICM